MQALAGLVPSKTFWETREQLRLTILAETAEAEQQGGCCPSSRKKRKKSQYNADDSKISLLLGFFLIFYSDTWPSYSTVVARNYVKGLTLTVGDQDLNPGLFGPEPNALPIELSHYSFCGSIFYSRLIPAFDLSRNPQNFWPNGRIN